MDGSVGSNFSDAPDDVAAGQSPRFTGYRRLDAEDVALVERVKELEQVIGGFYRSLVETPRVDREWALIGRQALQQGLMALVRAITRPVDPFDTPERDAADSDPVDTALASPTRSRVV